MKLLHKKKKYQQMLLHEEELIWLQTWDQGLELMMLQTKDTKKIKFQEYLEDLSHT